MAASADTPNSEALKQEILGKEHETWEALKKGGNALLPFLARDCVMVFPGSAIFDHDTTPSLAEILTRSDLKPWTQYELDEVRVVSLGHDAAQISYEVNATRTDEPQYHALITSVWRRANGSWEMTLHQQTPVDIPK